MSSTSPPISVQLYSLREEAGRDFEGVLRRLGDIGFVGVELAGFHGMSTARFQSVIDDAGLVVSSGHVGVTAPDELNPILDDLQSVGADIAILAFLPPDAFATKASISECAASINAANAIAMSRGMTFGYHNHWWEFEQLVDGETAWSWLVAELEPSVVIELDTYWATVGGQRAADVITDLGSRVRLLHLKDGPADDPRSPMVAVGSGAVDVGSIVDAGNAAGGVAWHVVELDRCATDMMTAIADSHAYLVANGMSKGRS